MNDNKKELFIVEGLSAASTLEQAANPQKHTILPLQGKLINVEKASTHKVMANEICQKLLATLGCDAGAACDVSQLSFARIIILSDPDMDGTHSRWLLFLFFKHYLSALLEAGRVHVLMPPLYRLQFSTDSKVDYAWSEEERLEIAANNQADSPEVMRLKGVAQFNRSECGALFLNPESRNLFRVQLVEQKLQLVLEKPHARSL